MSSSEPTICSIPAFGPRVVVTLHVKVLLAQIRCSSLTFADPLLLLESEDPYDYISCHYNRKSKPYI